MVDYVFASGRVNNTVGKMAYYLSTHNSICVSVSGGSDSDVIVHMIATKFREYLPKIHFVFANTGVEYRATLSHLDYLEQKYNIHIDRVQGTPIPVAVKKYGVPFCSKKVSDVMERLQKHGFQWEDFSLAELLYRYPRSRAALRWWCNDWGDKSRFNINWNRGLKEFLICHRPQYKVSAACCNVSKKYPLIKYQKEHDCDMYITGERKCEGGARSGAHASCFEQSHGQDHYMPLWFWSDDVKEWYCGYENITHSDCYKVYGLKRTGCVGCPFATNLWDELEVMKQYEPACYKLCVNVFGNSYIMRHLYETYKGGEKNDD